MSTQTKAKHTPGPWRVELGEKPTPQVEQAARELGIPICELTTVVGDIKQWTHNESYSTVVAVLETKRNWESSANARLIAAAPALLEAVKAALPFVEAAAKYFHEQKDTGQWTGLHGIAGQLEAAIHKAEV